MKHYPRGPSAATRWINCPGSIELSAGCKSTPSVYSRQGTDAHELLERRLLLGGGWEDFELSWERDVFDATTVMVDHVELLRSLEPVDEWIEKTIDPLEPLPGDFGGTVDYACTVFGESDKSGQSELTLHVVDYKHGAGLEVEAVGNEQMLSYALLLATRFRFIPDRVVMTVVQPNCGSGVPKSWTVDFDTVQHFADTVQDTVGKSELSPGEHCRFCPAYSKCPEVKSLAIESAKLDFGKLDSPEFTDDDATLLKLMRSRSVIKKLLESVPTLMVERMEKGVEFEGYKAVRRFGNRKWSSTEEHEILEGLRKNGVARAQAITRGVKSPTVIARDYGEEAVAGLVSRDDKGLIAVPVTDKRQDELRCGEFEEL